MQVIDRPDMWRHLDITDQTLTGADVGHAERSQPHALGCDRHTRRNAIPLPLRQTSEDAIEIRVGIRNEPPCETKLGSDGLRQFNIEAARFVAVHELERRIGQCRADA